MTTASSTIDQLAAALRGPLIQPADPEYEDARHVFNGMIDRRPRLITRPVDVADVMAAVNFARDEGLMLSVRGGGHNVAGFGTNDGGLVIDLSLMKGIRVDPEKRTDGAMWTTPPTPSASPRQAAWCPRRAWAALAWAGGWAT